MTFSTGNALGVATVTGHAIPPYESINILCFMSPGPFSVLAEINKTPTAIQAFITNGLPLLKFMTKANINSTGLMSNSPVAITGNF